MPLIKNEREISGGDFLKFRDGDSLIKLLSNLYRVDSHYIESQKTSAICVGEDKCVLCKRGIRVAPQFYYVVEVQTSGGLKEDGILRLPEPVFYETNNYEKNMPENESKRNYDWAVNRDSSGDRVVYDTQKGSKIEIDEELIKINNELLIEKIGDYENTLKAKYKQLVNSVARAQEADPSEVSGNIPF